MVCELIDDVLARLVQRLEVRHPRVVLREPALDVLESRERRVSTDHNAGGLLGNPLAKFEPRCLSVGTSAVVFMLSIEIEQNAPVPRCSVEPAGFPGDLFFEIRRGVAASWGRHDQPRPIKNYTRCGLPELCALDRSCKEDHRYILSQYRAMRRVNDQLCFQMRKKEDGEGNGI